MAIIDTIGFEKFCDGFLSDYKNNFSYEGKKALFEYLEELSESLDEDIEYDPIAFCCDYTEYENLEELQGNCTDIKSMEELEEKTIVILIENSERFIIQNF